MQHIPATPLGQALAAIIHLLIAAIAEHAREHPMLAGGCRASIRQLEKLIRRFDALAAEWQAAQTDSRPPRRPTQPIQSGRTRRAADPCLRRAIITSRHVPSARAPPGQRAPPMSAA